MFADINDLLNEAEQEILNDPDADIDDNDSSKAISDEEEVHSDEEEAEEEAEEDEDEPPRRNRKVANGTPVRVRQRKVIGSSYKLRHLLH